MFQHCTTVAELDAAYEQAVANVKTEQTFEQLLADLAAGRTPAEDDRAPQWNAIAEAHHARWSELTGRAWPTSTTPVLLGPRHFEDSDRPDMEQ